MAVKGGWEEKTGGSGERLLKREERKENQFGWELPIITEFSHEWIG